ncbi:MAG: hypothetical protein ACR2PL_10265 [Dehalococcoidia bacterium]
MKRPKPPRQLNLGRGLPPITIVSDAEAEEAEFVVCMPDGQAEYFDDDVRSVCFFCNCRIHYRPHCPKKPPKVCINCMVKVSESRKVVN